MDISILTEALFASPLRPSDRPTEAEIRSAITTTLCVLGPSGCLGEVAQEYGEHPESAVVRMRWALDQVHSLQLAA